jgi:hypothetical protein
MGVRYIVASDRTLNLTRKLQESFRVGEGRQIWVFGWSYPVQSHNFSTSPSQDLRSIVWGFCQLALSWGCRLVALHYDINDEAIFGLYDSLGYRRAICEPAWAPYVMGRPGTRLCLMLKLLKPSAKASPAAVLT